MKKILFSLALFSLVFCLGCDQDNNDPINPINSGNQSGNNEFSAYFGNETSRTFLGTVMDVNHQPIPDVTITIGNATAQTDVNGIFIIQDAPVHERFGYVKAEKDGYLTGSRSVIPSDGTNKVSIILLEKIVSGTVNSGSEGTVSLTNGATVKLSGDYVNPDGSSYSGSVDVVLHHLDPTNEDMQYQMPGMLYGANSDNQERLLQSYGMLAVELIGSNGESLNLADDTSAEITLPVDAGLLSNAPATIPLWHFDEDLGYWVEDGEANLVGNAYVGTVSHFSFWNCDVPAQTVTLCVNATDESSNALTNLYITITSTTYGTRGGFTNEQGQVCGLVPQNEPLELNVYNYDICGSASIYTSTVGPFATDDSVDIMIPTNTNLISETVVGTFNNCDSNPVTDGYVILNYGMQGYGDLVTDGNFEITVLRCTSDDTFELIGSDYANLQVTDTLNYTFTTPITNVGNLTACNTIDEFVQYTIDSSQEVFIIGNIYASFTENDPQLGGVPTLNISGSNSTVNCFYLFGVLNPSPFTGTYDNYDWNTSGDTGLNIQECTGMSSNINMIFNLTTLGAVGEYIDINFTGSYDDSSGSSHTITGVVHAQRDL